jgi:hypothetical protein
LPGPRRGRNEVLFNGYKSGDLFECTELLSSPNLKMVKIVKRTRRGKKLEAFLWF